MIILTLSIAWKKENNVYLICDSVTSSKSVTDSGMTSFGEKETRYGETFYIKETTKKIIKIGDFGFISFAGDVERARESIRTIKDFLPFKTLSEIVRMIQDSFDTESNDFFELLIICRENEDNKIYYIRSDNFDLQEIDTAKMVGSATNIMDFETNLSNYILGMNTNLKNRFYFLDILTSIQCASMKYSNDFLLEGVGGFYWGGYIDKNGELNWPPDLLYSICEGKAEPKNVSILDFEDSVLISSAYNNKISIYSDVDRTWDSEKLMKIINTRIPDTIITYDEKLNVKQADVIFGNSLTPTIFIRQIRTSHYNSKFFIKKISDI